MNNDKTSDKLYAIVIGASSESIHAIKVAKKKGLKVLAFDGNKDAEGLKYADESYVVDITKPRKIVKIINNKKIKSKEMVVLPVPIGRSLVSIGYFNKHYHLTGPTKRTCEICTDKWLFHKVLSNKKMRNINCKLIRKHTIPKKIKNFPAIIKPRYGAGSREVLYIADKKAWKEALLFFPSNEDFIIEDAVSGIEYGIDGMVLENKFNLVLLRKKLLTLPPYRQCVGYISICNDDALLKKISVYIQKITSIIKLKNGIIHADIIINRDQIFVIELSARPSGHRLHNLFTPMVTGVDIISEYLDYSSGKCIVLNTKKNIDTFLIRYFDIESEIKRIPDEDMLISKYNLLDYECNMKLGEVKKIKDGHSLMNRGFFILKEHTEIDVCKKANELLSEFLQ